MTIGASSTDQPLSHAGDVVAGLVNNVLASAVGAAAFREAAARGARIRFLQVLPPGMSADDHASAASVLFDVALKSLQQTRRMPCIFETVVGTAPETLVELSRGAALLVVGADAPDAEIRVADYCEQHCEWDVLVVSEPLQPAFGYPERGRAR